MRILVTAASNYGATEEQAMVVAFRAPEGDFRDWVEIKNWAAQIADSLQPQS